MFVCNVSSQSCIHQFHAHFFADGEEPQKLNLPNQWLWDIIDEFVYQFQSFCQYKANPSKRTPEELKVCCWPFLVH